MVMEQDGSGSVPQAFDIRFQMIFLHIGFQLLHILLIHDLNKEICPGIRQPRLLFFHVRFSPFFMGSVSVGFRQRLYRLCRPVHKEIAPSYNIRALPAHPLNGQKTLLCLRCDQFKLIILVRDLHAVHRGHGSHNSAADLKIPVLFNGVGLVRPLCQDDCSQRRDNSQKQRQYGQEKPFFIPEHVLPCQIEHRLLEGYGDTFLVFAPASVSAAFGFAPFVSAALCPCLFLFPLFSCFPSFFPSSL